MKQEKTNQEKTSARQKNPPIIHLKKDATQHKKNSAFNDPTKTKKH
jgi:hypothetical protein